ncbi:hypothetical protein B296_00011399 [Ensete ventricosum]|uniref:Uncharacterized protein n=1 Tax=Ensete ventricosum TaxID=4639 RepID=A0A426ZWF0_ENSVE|nr:hypothetical protein B296_00011399 [Ensete ventricosum]
MKCQMTLHLSSFIAIIFDMLICKKKKEKKKRRGLRGREKEEEGEDDDNLDFFSCHAIRRLRAISSPRAGRRNVSPHGENERVCPVHTARYWVPYHTERMLARTGLAILAYMLLFTPLSSMNLMK